MVREDPFDPDAKTFECTSCGHRLTASDGHPTCPECSGETRNISVPRE